MLYLQSTTRQLTECVDLLLKLDEPAAALCEEFLTLWDIVFGQVTWYCTNAFMKSPHVSNEEKFSVSSLNLIAI